MVAIEPKAEIEAAVDRTTPKSKASELPNTNLRYGAMLPISRRCLQQYKIDFGRGGGWGTLCFSNHGVGLTQRLEVWLSIDALYSRSNLVATQADSQRPARV